MLISDQILQVMGRSSGWRRNMDMTWPNIGWINLMTMVHKKYSHLIFNSE